MATGNAPFISEEEKLRIHLNTTYTERFRMLMRLIRLSQKLQKAKITYPKTGFPETKKSSGTEDF